MTRRTELLSQWAEASAARHAHPREGHLITLMVSAGAAGESRGRLALRDNLWGLTLASYRFD